MIYADYTYYKDTYKGGMPEEDFNRLSRQASAYIENITFGRSEKSYPVNMQNKIKDACCAVSDVLYKNENDGGEVISQSVGSWSKQYANSGKTLDQKLYNAAEMYLAMTGLMYQGCGLNV